LEAAICQNCGSFLKSKAKTCPSCNRTVSTFSSTSLPSIGPSTKPLTADINTDQAVLERLLISRPNYAGVMPPAAKINDFVQAMGGNGHTGTARGGRVSTLTRPNEVEPGADPTDAWFTEQDPISDLGANHVGQILQAPDHAPELGSPATGASVERHGSFFEAAPLVEAPPGKPDFEADVAANLATNNLDFSSKPGEQAIELASQSVHLAPVDTAQPASAQPPDASLFAPASRQSVEELAPQSPLPSESVKTQASAKGRDFFDSNPFAATASQPAVSSPPPLSNPASATVAPVMPPAYSASSAMVAESSTSLPGSFAAAGSPPQVSQSLGQAPPTNSQPSLFDGAPASVFPSVEPADAGKAWLRGATAAHSSTAETTAATTQIPPVETKETVADNKSPGEAVDTKPSEDLLPGHGFDVPPHRRSFSGKPDGAQAKAVTQPEDKADSKDEDDADSAETKKDPNSTDLELFGITLSKKKAIVIACLATLVLFLGIQAFCAMATGLFSAINDRMGGSSQAKLTGIWRFAAKVNNSMTKGVMLIHQHSDQIYGEGKDNAMGPFKFSGSLKGGGGIEFTKQYCRGGQDIGKPISFQGELEAASNPPFAKGDFQTTFREGMGWRGQVVTLTGPWEAEMIRPLAETGAEPGPGARYHPNSGSGTPTDFATKCLYAAGALLFIVFCIWMLAIWVFGPDGFRAQRDKAKYIPTQVQKEHKKELKELAQPLKAGSLPLGRRMEWRFWTFWEKKDLALPPSVRVTNPHVVFLGGGGKGKTRLMAKMIAHDIGSNDRAVVIIDSDGSLSHLISRWIAAHPQGKALAKRTQFIDPTYQGGSLAYNPLEMPYDGNLSNAAAAIEFGFKAIYTEPPGSQSQWTPQTAQILRSAAVLLMMTNRTLADLPNLLQDNDFRDNLLDEAEKKRREKSEYGPLLDSWNNYKKMARSEQWINWVEPILNRVQRTLSDQRLRPVLTSHTGCVNLREVISDKKILIVNLPKGELHDSGYLLGALMVTGLKQAALAVSGNGKNSNRTVALYLDEFDHFIEKETFKSITTETKVFHIGLLGATKTLQDFPEDFRSDLVANKFGTMAIFALPKKDGDMLGPQMFRVDGRKRKHETLTNFVNPINTSPQFEFVSDEEKLNIDKILGQPERVYFCYRGGSVAGLFHMKSHPFNDIADKDVNLKLIDKMRGLGTETGQFVKPS
jgi:hypothetical protein